VANTVSEEGTQGLQLGFPGNEADLAAEPIILKQIEADVCQLGYSFELAEADKQLQLSTVFPPGRESKVAMKVAALVNFAVRVSRRRFSSIFRINSATRRLATCWLCAPAARPKKSARLYVTTEGI
jgi:hypothetical protein